MTLPGVLEALPLLAIDPEGGGTVLGGRIERENLQTGSAVNAFRVGPLNKQPIVSDGERETRLV